MQTLNSFEIGTVSGISGELPTTFDFPDRMKCARLILELTVPLKNPTAGPLDLEATDYLKIAQRIMGSTTLGFGAKKREVMDDAISFDRLRRIHIAQTGRDFQVKVSAGSINAGKYLGIDGVALGSTTVAAGASVTVTFLLARPFEFHRFSGSAIQKWCPGTSQMRQLRMKVIRGAGAPVDSGIIQEGPATCVVRAKTLDTKDDPWVRPPRCFPSDAAGLEQAFPGGALLAAWDRNAAGDATPLGLISLMRDGDSDLFSDQQAADLVNDSAEQVPLGAVDLNDHVTVLFQLEAKASIDDVPTASGFKLKQNTSSTTMESVLLIAPPTDEEWSDTYVAPNVTAGDEAAKASVPAGEQAGHHTAAVSGVRVLRPYEPGFELDPGRIYKKNRPPVNHIPPAIVNRIKKGVEGSDPGVAPSALADATSQIARFLPGGSSPRRGASTGVKQEVMRVLAPNTGIIAQTHALLTQVR